MTDAPAHVIFLFGMEQRCLRPEAHENSTVSSDVFDEREHVLLRTLEERPKHVRGRSQLFLSGATFSILHLDTSNDRSVRAIDDVVVQERPVLALAQAMARFRRWFRCSPLCERAGLVFAQIRGPFFFDSLTLPHTLQTRLHL